MPSMRHSRSIPENASIGLSSIGQQPTRRTPHPSALYRCPSQNIDSGISLYSADIPYNKAKEMKTMYVYHTQLYHWIKLEIHLMKQKKNWKLLLLFNFQWAIFGWASTNKRWFKAITKATTITAEAIDIDVTADAIPTNLKSNTRIMLIIHIESSYKFISTTRRIHQWIARTHICTL